MLLVYDVKLQNAKRKTLETSLSLFESALNEFRLDNGRYPTTEEGLHSLFVKTSGLPKWDGPYLPPTKESSSNLYLFDYTSSSGNEHKLTINEAAAFPEGKLNSHN